jgi:hypothetical protein
VTRLWTEAERVKSIDDGRRGVYLLELPEKVNFLMIFIPEVSTL